MSAPNARSNWRPVLHDAQGRPTQRGTRFQNTVTGQNVSRRRFQELIGKPLPKQVAQPRQGRGPSRMYVRAYRTYAQEHAMSWGSARTDPQFKSRWAHLRALWRAETRGEVVDHSPNSDLALTLEELGIRAQGAAYYVGDTP